MLSKIKQAGFTLIELMVSLALGLLLVAVAVQLVFSGQVAYRVQQAGATLQDSGVFGVSYISQSIRLANYGNLGAMNDETLFGGIVLSGESANTTLKREGNLKGLRIGSAMTGITDNKYLTNNALNASAYGDNSDQLVVMYQAPRDMQNCEGENVTGPVITTSTYTPAQYVIERYYIKNLGTSTAPDAALYCDAVIFTDKEADRIADSKGVIKGLSIGDYSTGGVMVINHVDMMRIQLVVRQTGTKAAPNVGTQTMSIDTYKNISIQNAQTTPKVEKTARPAIIGINVGMIIRSNDSAGKKDGAKTFTVLDKTVTTPNDGFIRKPYITNIALRNGGLNGEVIVND